VQGKESVVIHMGSRTKKERKREEGRENTISSLVLYTLSMRARKEEKRKRRSDADAERRKKGKKGGEGPVTPTHSNMI